MVINKFVDLQYHKKNNMLVRVINNLIGKNTYTKGYYKVFHFFSYYDYLQ